MNDNYAEQVKRLNPFDITLTQSKRFQSILKQLGAEDGKTVWDAIAKISDEQIEYIKNGAEGAVNLPYIHPEWGFVECDNGYIKVKSGGLAAPHTVTGDKYSASYMADHDAYMVVREIERLKPIDRPTMILNSDGTVEWRNNPTQSMKNDMDMILRSLRRAVDETTISGKPWQDWGGR